MPGVVCYWLASSVSGCARFCSLRTTVRFHNALAKMGSPNALAKMGTLGSMLYLWELGLEEVACSVVSLLWGWSSRLAM